MSNGNLGVWETLGRRESFLGDGGLAKPALFLALLRLERKRADRGGKQFSLATFDVDGARLRNGKIGLVAARIKEEKRSIDEVGWLDEATIGVLLPATRPEGGKSFARRVSQKIPSGMAFPFEIYSYPGNWRPQVEDETLNYGKPHNPSVDNSARSTAEAEKRLGQRKFAETVFCPKVPTWKKILDFGGALFGLVACSPLIFLLAAYIKTVSRGPVLFRQQRLGRGGKPFIFLKFRTMKTDNNESFHKNHIRAAIRGDGAMSKLDDEDPRIIPGGRILRRACLDELPQLINVLRGEMSLVGPRPCLSYEAAEFVRWHKHRFDILPGLTGLWQVSGKNKLTFSQMIRLDISYAEHMSLWLDLKIILITLPAIAGMIFESLARVLRTHAAVSQPKVGKVK